MIKSGSPNAIRSNCMAKNEYVKLTHIPDLQPLIWWDTPFQWTYHHYCLRLVIEKRTISGFPLTKLSDKLFNNTKMSWHSIRSCFIRLNVCYCFILASFSTVDQIKRYALCTLGQHERECVLLCLMHFGHKVAKRENCSHSPVRWVCGHAPSIWWWWWIKRRKKTHPVNWFVWSNLWRALVKVMYILSKQQKIDDIGCHFAASILLVVAFRFNSTFPLNACCVHCMCARCVYTVINIG